MTLATGSTINLGGKGMPRSARSNGAGDVNAAKSSASNGAVAWIWRAGGGALSGAAAQRKRFINKPW